MATFDSNAMLIPSTTTLGTVHSVGGGLELATGNWLTLGTGKRSTPFAGLPTRLTVRTSIQTAASNTDTMRIDFQQSDDQTTINERTIVDITGTEMGAANLGWSTLAGYERFDGIITHRRYIRAIATARGLGAAWGTIAIGVDADGLSPYR